MAGKRGRPKKVGIVNGDGLTLEQMMAGAEKEDSGVEAKVVPSATPEPKDHNMIKIKDLTRETASYRQGFLESVAISLVIEMCKTKGLSLDDHAQRAVETATKLADLLGVE